MISLLGQILSQRPATDSEDEVRLPQAAVTRCARLLEATAEMMAEGVATAYDSTPTALTATCLDVRRGFGHSQEACGRAGYRFVHQGLTMCSGAATWLPGDPARNWRW